jgi:hypothetical protein
MIKGWDAFDFDFVDYAAEFAGDLHCGFNGVL